MSSAEMKKIADALGKETRVSKRIEGMDTYPRFNLRQFSGSIKGKSKTKLCKVC